MLEQILYLATAIAQPSETEKPLLEALCTAAEAELKQRLREDVTQEDCQDAFACAAALLAAGGQYDGGLLRRRRVRIQRGAWMRAQLEEIMRTHGQEIALIRQEDSVETAVLAFLQPLLKEREDLPVTATPLGAVNDQRWLYIGPAAQEFVPGDEVRFNGSRFVAQETMMICFRREALYFRAVLRQKKEAAR